ncbi:uncharacterized protein LOC106072270 [Biomphalaria glabrata]|uniref:Uncharacterized protein LOC106072270 n=1 Tax=Biomphalaria glabrata TaxID=6526 RepID=A0A9W3AAM8_BIOGL|nr:uncharacterized protein LOC106072270 [Biomphalaria glabrata]
MSNFIFWGFCLLTLISTCPACHDVKDDIQVLLRCERVDHCKTSIQKLIQFTKAYEINWTCHMTCRKSNFTAYKSKFDHFKMNMTQLKKSGQKSWQNEVKQNANNYSELLEQVIKDIKSASELSVITLFSREPLDENKCGKVTSVQSLYHHTHRVAKEFLYALECWGKMCNKCHTLMSGRTNSTTNITKPKDPNIPASRVQGAQSNNTRQLSKGINGSVITNTRKKVKSQTHLLNGTTTQGQGHRGEVKKGNLNKNVDEGKKKIRRKCVTSAKGAKCKNKKTTKETVSVSPPPVAKTTHNSKMDKKKEKSRNKNKNKDQQTSETKSPAEEKPKKEFKKGQKGRKQKTVDQSLRKSKE